MLHPLRRPRTIAFLAATLVIYSVAIALVANLPRWNQPGIVALALLVDLTVVVPLLFALLVRRSGGWTGVVPVFVVSLIGARLVLPESAATLLPALRLLALPAELATACYVLWRFRVVFSGLADGADPVSRLENAIKAAVPNPRLATLLAYEFSVLYYALFSWRRKPAIEPGLTFSYHRSGGYGAIVFALLIVSAIEIVGTHLLVAMLSSTAAWILTAIGLYAVLWIIGDYQALRLIPLRVGPNGIFIRLGLRWTIFLPREAIESMTPAPRPALPRRMPGHLSAALMTSPQWRITLREPIEARGPYGISRRVTIISLAADDRVGLRDALERFGSLSRPAA